MSSFEVVASVDELPSTGTLMVEIDDQIVMLIRVEDQIYCIDDVCTHDGGSFDGGDLCGHAISCPRHGAQFDVRTGQPLSMPATEPTLAHDVKVVDGDILVRLNDEETDSGAPRRGAQCAPTESQGKMAAPPTVQDDTGEPAIGDTVASDTVASDSEASVTEASDSVASDSETPVDAAVVAPTPPVGEETDEALAPAGELPPGAAAGELNEDRCREELKKVIDPELFVNIVDLGLIYTVAISDSEVENQHHVAIDMTMTSPMCPAGPQLIAQSKQVLMQLDTVSDVEVKVVMDPPWTPDKMTDDARDQLGIF